MTVIRGLVAFIFSVKEMAIVRSNQENQPAEVNDFIKGLVMSEK